MKHDEVGEVAREIVDREMKQSRLWDMFSTSNTRDFLIKSVADALRTIRPKTRQEYRATLERIVPKIIGEAIYMAVAATARAKEDYERIGDCCKAAYRPSNPHNISKRVEYALKYLQREWSRLPEIQAILKKEEEER